MLHSADELQSLLSRLCTFFLLALHLSLKVPGRECACAVDEGQKPETAVPVELLTLYIHVHVHVIFMQGVYTILLCRGVELVIPTTASCSHAVALHHLNNQLIHVVSGV